MSSNAWLITWNVGKWQWKGYDELCKRTKNGETVIRNWACHSKQPQVGDEVFLLKLGDQPKGVIGHGQVVRESFEKKHYEPEKAAAGKRVDAIEVEFDCLLNYEANEYLHQEKLKEYDKKAWSPPQSGISVKPELLPVLQRLWKEAVNRFWNVKDSTGDDDSIYPEELRDSEGETIIEGAKKTITVNAYERDPRAKKKCKEYYLARDGRIKCQICGFDFGKIYGSEYDNTIHVHHIIPISQIGEEYELDPIKDLIPVCANCHLVLHVGDGISVCISV